MFHWLCREYGSTYTCLLCWMRTCRWKRSCFTIICKLFWTVELTKLVKWLLNSSFKDCFKLHSINKTWFSSRKSQKGHLFSSSYKLFYIENNSDSSFSAHLPSNSFGIFQYKQFDSSSLKYNQQNIFLCFYRAREQQRLQNKIIGLQCSVSNWWADRPKWSDSSVKSHKIIVRFSNWQGVGCASEWPQGSGCLEKEKEIMGKLIQC